MKKPVSIEVRVCRPFQGGNYIDPTNSVLGSMHEQLERANFLPGEVLPLIRREDFDAMVERLTLDCARQEFHDLQASFQRGRFTTRAGVQLCEDCFMATAPIDEIDAHMVSIGCPRPTPQQSRDSMLKLAETLKKRAEEIPA
jgi:hypothetical protein